MTVECDGSCIVLWQPSDVVLQHAEWKSRRWDFRFLSLAKVVRGWSKDPGTKNGCVIVRDRVPLSFGYNGFPRGMEDHPDLLNDRVFKLDHVVHAEENAILNAGREGVRLLGSTLYVYGLPVCNRCAVSIVQAGVSRVVQFVAEKNPKPEWLEAERKTEKVFGECGLGLTTYTEWIET